MPRAPGITKRFPGVLALEDVNLTVRHGEIHAICGENGAGKSTPDEGAVRGLPARQLRGEIHFDGEAGAFTGIRDSEERGVVIIHQELALVPQLSIAENIFLGNERAARGIVNWNRTNVAAAELLDRRPGRHIYAVGGNLQAARLSGVDSPRLVIMQVSGDHARGTSA